ncbi:cellulase family glycosylhydrolase [Hymenobacter properus]|uniref:mannan endo-1,4-beta-mannosidase n=1 Tax=Hymenobacter properus TaxID=2791026 RepID=A0A931FHK1_9BACT|nr:cellulase family glycosylhydrolase [Hymenobacter properus]MBF9141147.1 cellulase family glycosylhydrolase [Hymenobacter properus]MBR7719956.1 cellulase family glycosylhydrolase [Microvirga sp. SRT04]
MFKRPTFLLLLSCFCHLFSASQAQAQKPAKAPAGDVYVDKKGVLRWQKGGQEVALFGVNYTAPFAYSYRAIQKVGGNHEQAIRQDVYHLARLGVDAFRVHVWDVEITDTTGNLLENEHLRLLDFLVNELKQRGIKIILTPIAYWNNGYPEPDTGTGFSSIFSKGEAYTNPRAIAAQERYLTQFLNHRNPYTKALNREDPDILAFEVCNEPRYHKPEEQVTSFANRMAAAIRATGCRKPVFYNVSENPDVYEAILNAKVDGLTFQWYPQGLVANHALRGNFLPYVDQYPIPYRTDPRFRSKAKMVYEFESADIIQPVMYPFMARSFREAGFQWATQFAYDPLAIAHANTEYQTHYLNLAYTPAKAISLLIAGKVFRTVKRGQQFPRYPQDSVFSDFHVSYRQQLSEVNTPEEFYYTADTRTVPKQPAKLQHLAGVGSSPVATYGGTGAYFLDKLAPGVWRLEVMPDAVPIRDPFEKASLSKPVTQVLWTDQPLQLHLPDLGPAFAIKGLSEGNSAQSQAADGRTILRPGAYLLSAPGKATAAYTERTVFNNYLRLSEFVTPKNLELGRQLRHTPPAQAVAGQPLRLTATLTDLAATDSVFLVAQHYYGRTRTLPMSMPRYATVEATVPADLLYPGQLRYWIVVRKGTQATTFPGGFSGQPRDWDYAHLEHFEVPIVAAGTPLPLFEAGRDQERIEARTVVNNAWTDYVTTPVGALALRLVQGPLRSGQAAQSGPAASLRAYFGDKLASRTADVAGFQTVVVRARSSQPGAQLKVTLTTKDAVSYSAALPVGAELQEVRLPLSAFRPDALLLMPRPYPGFNALQYQPAGMPAFKLADAEVLQVIWEAATPTNQPLTVDIESVTLQ